MASMAKYGLFHSKPSSFSQTNNSSESQALRGNKAHFLSLAQILPKYFYDDELPVSSICLIEQSENLLKPQR